MSVENVKNFIVAAGTNPELAAKVASAVAGKTAVEAASAVSELAKAEGFDFTAAEAAEAEALHVDSQLSEDALNSVAGGAGFVNPMNNTIAVGEPTGGGFWAGFKPPTTDSGTGGISTGPGPIVVPGGPVF